MFEGEQGLDCEKTFTSTNPLLLESDFMGIIGLPQSRGISGHFHLLGYYQI